MWLLKNGIYRKDRAIVTQPGKGIVPGDVPDNVAPHWEEDFSTYADSTAWRNRITTTPGGEFDYSLASGGDANDLSIDTSVFDTGYSQSLRYDFEARSVSDGDRCGNNSVGWWVNSVFPNGCKEFWTEARIRWSDDFYTHEASFACSNAADHKLFRVTTDSTSNFAHFGLKDGHQAGENWNFSAPSADFWDQNATRSARSEWDGAWHTIRFHGKLSSSPGVSDGLVRALIDDNELVDGSGGGGLKNNLAVNTGDATEVLNHAFGLNRNTYIAIEVSMWLQYAKIYVEDPGWGI